jgi:hypothetical protein
VKRTMRAQKAHSLIGQVYDRRNLRRAWERVKKNKGAGGSLKESRGFYHQIAFALPFGLASAHAGVWQCRPAATSSGRFRRWRSIPRLGCPQLLRPAASDRDRHSSPHGRDV